jgi:hypothetical protein
MVKVNVNVASVVTGLFGAALLVGAVTQLGPVASAVVAALWSWAVVKALVLGGVGAVCALRVFKKQDVVSVVVGLFGAALLVWGVVQIGPVASAVVAALWSWVVVKALVLGVVGAVLAGKAVKELV